MPTIGIRWTTLHRDPSDASDAMLATLSSLRIKLRGYHPVAGGFAAQLVDEEDCDKAFSDICTTAMLKVGLRVIVNPTHRARRTLVVHGVDSSTQLTFEENFKKKYTWAPISNFYIDKTRGNIKLILGSLSAVDRLLKEGIKLETTEFPPYALARDQYHVIPECHSCYRLFPDHKTRNCPDKHIKLCSKCGSTSHRWNKCDSNDVCCTNCLREGWAHDHETRDALKCPIRNEALKKVRYESKLSKLPAPPKPRTFPPAPSTNPWNTGKLGSSPQTGGRDMGPPAPKQPKGMGKGKGGKGKGGKTPEGNKNQGNVRIQQMDSQSQDTDSQTEDEELENIDMGNAENLAQEFIGRAGIAEPQNIIGMAKALGEKQVPKIIGDTLMSLLYGCVAEATRPGTFQKAVNAAQTNCGLTVTKFPVYNHIFGRDNVVSTKKRGKKRPKNL